MELQFSLEQLVQLIGYVISISILYWHMRERIVKLESKVLVHEERLKEGGQIMKNLNHSINELNITIAKLETTLKERE